MATDDNDEGQVQDDYSSEPPKSSKPYLDAIKESEKAFEQYNDKADNIDKLYADLARLANGTRDRQFQMFWANVEVLKPSIYSRPPVPVVVPRFKDRRPVPRAASEILERACIVGFELEDIDQVMRMIRDDLAIQARGVPWVRYEVKDGQQRACVEHTDRRDFLHELQRYWKDVGWVAKRSWLTTDQMKDRFKRDSGDAYLDAEYTVRKDDKQNGAADSESKAGVWEIWDKNEGKVIWVTPGVDVVLDRDEPDMKLEGFFPCPKPAYGTTQRRSLIPVPDMLFYKDQLEEINELTARIAALSEAVKVRGFYPAGSGEIGDAIESAIKRNDNNQIMIPISNWAAFGNTGAKDMIVWLPIDVIANTITGLVALRKELIDDVYQITGLSDIMRGSTEASETATAQQLKSQYGSVRIRDRQAELVRVARDIARIVAEIMAENFSPKTLLDMSQYEIKTDAEVAAEAEQAIASAQQQAQQALANPEMVAQAQQNPQAAQQMLDQLKQQTEAQVDKINKQPTIEKVMGLLREQRLRPFVLDIETDSTIQPNEDAAKQRATEFVTAVGGFMNQAAAIVQIVPQSAPLMSDTLKYVASQFRAGRELEGSIEEFADAMKAMAGQPKPPDPAQIKAESDAKAADADAQVKVADAQAKQQETVAKAQDQQHQAAMQEIERNAKLSEADAKLRLMDAQGAQAAEKHTQEMEKGALEIVLLNTKIHQSEVQTDNQVKATAAKIEQTNTATDNSIRSTDASVQATADSTAIKADAAKAKSEESDSAPKDNGLSALTEKMERLSEILMAPNVIDRDPITNRVIGSRKQINSHP